MLKSCGAKSCKRAVLSKFPEAFAVKIANDLYYIYAYPAEWALICGGPSAPHAWSAAAGKVGL
jgi:hypothetical protein